MKGIKLQQFTTPNKESVYIKDKKYCVHLGNGYEGYFGSNEAVVSFLHETNSFLNHKLHDLNFIFIEAFSLYRIAWFYLDHNKRTKKINLSGIDDRVKRNISGIEHGFVMLTTRSHFHNGNYLSFKHFNNISTNLTEMLKDINLLFTQKGHTDRIYKIRQLTEQITAIKKQINTWPKNEESIAEKIKFLLL